MVLVQLLEDFGRSHSKINLRRTDWSLFSEKLGGVEYFIFLEDFVHVVPRVVLNFKTGRPLLDAELNLLPLVVSEANLGDVHLFA